jgi:hypothetical protein
MAQVRLVAAVNPAVRRRIRKVAPKCELRFVENRDELLSEIEHCDMLILGAHFEESTTVAALERVLARRDSLPVVCVRGVRSRYGQRSLHALRMALNELGAPNFIDLLDYPDDETGNAQVRALIEHLL